MKLGANTNNSALFQNYMTGIRITSKAVYSGGTTTGGTQQVFTPPLCPIPLTQSASTNITDLNGTDAVFLMKMLKTSYFNEGSAGNAVTVTGTVTGNELTQIKLPKQLVCIISIGTNNISIFIVSFFI